MLEWTRWAKLDTSPTSTEANALGTHHAEKIIAFVVRKCKDAGLPRKGRIFYVKKRKR